MGSAILYGDFKKATFHQLVTFLYGCVATFLGVFIIAWALRRAGARRGDDDEETYAYAEPALDTAALNRKLETISLDLDEPPSDEPRRPGAPKA